MIKINVELKERGYPIYINKDYSHLGGILDSVGLKGKIVIITDENVDRAQSDDVLNALSAYPAETLKYTIQPGEQSKNLGQVKDIYKVLMDKRLDRDCTLIALGGGVVGDITGFVASTFLRGINFVQVPTTLLAQADSSVGGKVGVDFEGNKNMIGSFYQPKFVYINVNSIRTLPDRELRNGLAETIKHGLILDKDFFEYVDCNMNKIFSYDVEVLQYMAKMNCRIKGYVVEQDEKEQGLRAILNFGHTVGHAIESVSEFRLLHGECVSIGIICAYKIAQQLNIIDSNNLIKVQNTLRKAKLPVSTTGFDVDKVYRQMFYDKKVKDNNLNIILPKQIGKVFQYRLEDEKLVKSVLQDVIK